MTSPRITDIYSLIRSQLGVENVDFEELDVSDIDDTDKVIAKANPGRVALVLVNLGTAASFVRPSEPATTSLGIRLGASGGSVSMNYLDDLILPSLEWHGISGTANQALFGIEVLLF